MYEIHAMVWKLQNEQVKSWYLLNTRFTSFGKIFIDKEDFYCAWFLHCLLGQKNSWVKDEQNEKECVYLDYF